MNSGRTLYAMLSIIFMLVVAGCATPTKRADFMSPNFNAGAIDEICVMPILDFRFSKETDLDLDRHVLSIVKSELERRKYNYTVVTDRALVDDMTVEDFEDNESEWISHLGPDNARWVLFVALLDSSSKVVFGSTGSAEMSAYLFDKASAELVWREKAIGRMGQGGLLGMAMVGMMEPAAVEAASRNLMLAMPVKK